VTLYEAESQLGGQLNLTRRILGKQEFEGLLRHFTRQLQLLSVDVRTRTRPTPDHLRAQAFEHVIVATGIVPRTPQIPGIDHPNVVGYIDVIQGRVEVGRRVAIIGAGGIGHDVADLLLDDGQAHITDKFLSEWGVDESIVQPGGWTAPHPAQPLRELYMLQRRPGRIGARLGKSTGWILRSRLKRNNVRFMAGVTYIKVDDDGLLVVTPDGQQTLAVDTIVICAGQEPDDRLATAMCKANIPFDVIGGARLAEELDAARAIEEGTRLAPASWFRGARGRCSNGLMKSQPCSPSRVDGELARAGATRTRCAGLQWPGVPECRVDANCRTARFQRTHRRECPNTRHCAPLRASIQCARCRRNCSAR
jgi:2,4-dienoyl-CoA reductase (NADPH2)